MVGRCTERKTDAVEECLQSDRKLVLPACNECSVLTGSLEFCHVEWIKKKNPIKCLKLSF